MTRIIMRGCNGRMGQMISNLVQSEEHAAIVAGIDVNKTENNGYPVFTSFASCNEKADVIIDFSSPKGLDEMLKYAINHKVGIVLCTTGLSEADIAMVNEAAEEVPILRSANMSLGVNMVIKLLQMAAKVLAEADFDIEIVEKHHNQKLDAPSGTALALADAMNEVLDKEYAYKYDRSLDRKKREKKEIGILAMRGGTIVGDHDVIFAGRDEVIEIKHVAYSREIFAKGALQAAKYLLGRAPGMYGMEDVIG